MGRNMMEQAANTRKTVKLQTIYYIVTAGLVCLRDLGAISYNKFLLAAVCGGFMALASCCDLVCMLLFTIPFLCGIPGTYIMLAGLVCYIIKRRFYIKRLAMGFILFALIMEALAAFWYPDLPYTDILQYIVFLSLLLLLIYDSNGSIQYARCLRVFNAAILIVGLTILITSIRNSSGNWLWLFSRGWFRIGEGQTPEGSDMALTLNANNLGYFCVTGISCALVLLSAEDKHRLFDAASVILFGLIGIFTQSRTFILLTAGVLGLYLCAQAASARKLLRSLLLLCVLCLAAGVWLNRNPQILEGLLARFTDSTMSTAGGRTTILRGYLEAWLNHPRACLIGTGVVEYREVLQQTGAVHNGLAQFFLCYGVVGGFVMLYALLKPLFDLKRHRIRLVYYLPWIAVVLFTQTIQFLNPCFLMLPYVAGIYALRLGLCCKNATPYRSDEENSL